MFKSVRKPSGEITTTWMCDVCGKTGWPLYRIAGYPTPEATEMVEKGWAVFTGCLVDPSDDHSHQCPHCEAGVDVDEDLWVENR